MAMRRWLELLLVASVIAGAQTLEDAQRLHDEGAAAFWRGDLDVAEAK